MVSVNYPNFAGTGAWTVSVGNEELVSVEKTENAPNSSFFVAKTLEFYNSQDCVVQINGSKNILIPAGVGRDLVNIKSFKLITAGVTYCCIIEY